VETSARIVIEDYTEVLFIIKGTGRTAPRNNYLSCLFIFILPLRVSALAGHLQAEYTIIFGKLPHYDGSFVNSA
jgi:hypothetical protein